MAKKLVQKGHRVSLVTMSSYFPEKYKFKKRVTKINIDGIDLIIIKMSYSNKLNYLMRTLIFIKFAIWSTLESLKVRNVDVVFATSTPLTIIIPAIAAKFKNNCKMVFEVRDLWPEIPIALGILRNPLLIMIARWLEKLAYRNSENIIALSEGMKSGIMGLGYPENKICVVPNACNTNLFQSPEDDVNSFYDDYPQFKNKVIVSYAGTIGMIYGLEYLIDIAYEMININPDICFIIAGDGGRTKFVRDYSIIKGVLNRNVWFLPLLSKTEVARLLSVSKIACSIIINRSVLWDNSANKFFDALAAKKPVMINYEGWHANIIREYEIGVVIPPEDPEKSARILNEYLLNDRKIKEAISVAEHLATNVYNQNILGKKFVDVIENAGRM